MTSSDQTLVRIIAPHFVAGITVEHDWCTEAEPIVRYMEGWTADRVRAYCKRKGWTAYRVADRVPNDD